MCCYFMEVKLRNLFCPIKISKLDLFGQKEYTLNSWARKIKYVNLIGTVEILYHTIDIRQSIFNYSWDFCFVIYLLIVRS
jgi:hypothetical protein